MKRFVIERNLPGVQNLAPGELREAAAKSNAAIASLGGKLTWEHSYVVEDKTFCIYIADSADTVMKNAEASGFPANKVTEVRTVLIANAPNANAPPADRWGVRLEGPWR